MSKFATKEIRDLRQGLKGLSREDLMKGEAARVGKDKAALFFIEMDETYGLSINGDVMTLDGVVHEGLYRRARDLMEELDEDAEIRLEINSVGGDATEAVAVLNYLLQDGRITETRVMGEAFSAASYLMLAAEKRTMGSGATVGIHDAWGLAIGDAAEMDMRGRMLDRLSDSIAGLYGKFCGGEKDEWRDLMKRTTIFTAEEALDAGFATEALEDAGESRDEARKPKEEKAVAEAAKPVDADIALIGLAGSLV